MSAIAFLLAGCWNAHDRPIGHRDVGFSISPRGDVLVFTAQGEGGRDLYLLELTGHKVSRIAKTREYEVGPRFSPDGNSLIYAAGRSGDRADHIFVRSLKGNDCRQLTSGDADDSGPEFSPDGSLIAFAREKTYNSGGQAPNWDGDTVLCVMNADGTGLREITRGDPAAGCPRFSPDGKTIFFQGPDGIYTVDIGGTKKPKLRVPLYTSGFAFSPDRQTIAFSKGVNESECEIFTCRADGSECERLTHLGQPHISPTGGGASTRNSPLTQTGSCSCSSAGQTAASVCRKTISGS